VFNLRQSALRILFGGVFMPVRIGDFVEGLSDEKTPTLRQGLVTSIYPDGKVLLEMGAVLVLCKEVTKISESGLNRAQRTWIASRRVSLDPTPSRGKNPTRSIAP
jgi:hypothetical protein